LAQSLEFIQRTQLTAPGRRIYNIFGDRRCITKHPQIRIAVRLIAAALIGIIAGIFLYWVTANNNREAKPRSLISPTKLAFSDMPVGSVILVPRIGFSVNQPYRRARWIPRMYG
jgi:hypothetical protein